MNTEERRKKNAEIFKALSHPIRLHIVELLLDGEKCVNDIRDFFEVTQPNISQHLNILKYTGIVDYRQEKNLRCYFLKEPRGIKKIVSALE
jgi:DNA-binding transcriptional ArsR family regulator